MWHPQSRQRRLLVLACLAFRHLNHCHRNHDRPMCRTLPMWNETEHIQVTHCASFEYTLLVVNLKKRLLEWVDRRNHPSTQRHPLLLVEWHSKSSWAAEVLTYFRLWHEPNANLDIVLLGNVTSDCAVDKIKSEKRMAIAPPVFKSVMMVAGAGLLFSKTPSNDNKQCLLSHESLIKALLQANSRTRSYQSASTVALDLWKLTRR